MVLEIPSGKGKDGDRNTSYLHHKASHRKKRNFIHGIRDGVGVWQVQHEKIEEEVEWYFDWIFSSSEPSDKNFQELLQHVRVSDLCDPRV